MTPFHLRSSKAGDSTFIYAVLELTLKHHVEAGGTPWARERIREKCDEHARDPSTTIVMVGEQDAGVYSACEREGAYWIDRLFLLPHFQRQGIGSALVAMARRNAAARGIPIRLQVVSTNPAKQFWLACGFTVTRLEGLFYFMQSAA